MAGHGPDALQAARVPPSEILPFLYLGNATNAANKKQLLEHGITHVLNMKECFYGNEPEEFKFLHVAMSDYGEQKLVDILEQCFSFLEDAKQRSGKVLVHCRGGINRSPTIVLAYLMAKEKFTLLEAFKHVKKIRPSIAPHERYIQQLQDYENTLYGKITLTVEEAGPSAQTKMKDLQKLIATARPAAKPGLIRKMSSEMSGSTSGSFSESASTSNSSRGSSGDLDSSNDRLLKFINERKKAREAAKKAGSDDSDEDMSGSSKKKHKSDDEGSDTSDPECRPPVDHDKLKKHKDKSSKKAKAAPLVRMIKHDATEDSTSASSDTPGRPASPGPPPKLGATKSKDKDKKKSSDSDSSQGSDSLQASSGSSSKKKHRLSTSSSSSSAANPGTSTSPPSDRKGLSSSSDKVDKDREKDKDKDKEKSKKKKKSDKAE